MIGNRASSMYSKSYLNNDISLLKNKFALLIVSCVFDTPKHWREADIRGLPTTIRHLTHRGALEWEGDSVADVPDLENHDKNDNPASCSLSFTAVP